MHDIYNLYDILNIPDNIITNSSNNIYNIIDNITNDEKGVITFNRVITIINKFHSYFHFEQSFANLLCAYIANIKGFHDLVETYLQKAIFQDHLNDIATKFFDYLAILQPDEHLKFIQNYNKHYVYEINFLHFAISNFTILSELKALDNGINCIYNHRAEYGISLLLSCGYKSHRTGINLAIGYLIKSDLDSAMDYASQTLSLLEANHLKFHKLAASFYLKRAILFDKLGRVDLAKNDRLHASNL